jgi:hypothetical protein
VTEFLGEVESLLLLAEEELLRKLALKLDIIPFFSLPPLGFMLIGGTWGEHVS